MGRIYFRCMGVEIEVGGKVYFGLGCVCVGRWILDRFILIIFGEKDDKRTGLFVAENILYYYIYFVTLSHSNLILKSSSTR